MGQLNIFGEPDLQPWEIARRYLNSVDGIAEKTVSSVSGGKTSSYMALHYPTDYHLFALVLTEDPNCKIKDTD